MDYPLIDRTSLDKLVVVINFIPSCDPSKFDNSARARLAQGNDKINFSLWEPSEQVKTIRFQN